MPATFHLQDIFVLPDKNLILVGKVLHGEISTSSKLVIGHQTLPLGGLEFNNQFLTKLETGQTGKIFLAGNSYLDLIKSYKNQIINFQE